MPGTCCSCAPGTAAQAGVGPGCWRGGALLLLLLLLLWQALRGRFGGLPPLRNLTGRCGRLALRTDGNAHAYGQQCDKYRPNRASCAANHMGFHFPCHATPVRRHCGFSSSMAPCTPHALPWRIAIPRRPGGLQVLPGSAIPPPHGPRDGIYSLDARYDTRKRHAHAPARRPLSSFYQELFQELYEERTACRKRRQQRARYIELRSRVYVNSLSPSSQ